jgi:mono/diheme cytochrome c family protein
MFSPLSCQSRLLALVLLAGLAVPPGPAGAAEPIDYRRDVKPILSSRCYACHGALRQRAGLRLDTGALIRKGSRGGPVVVPGKSDESLLLDAVTGKDRPRMPPEKEGPALTDKQIAVLRAWVDQGAKAPDEPVPEDPRKHWAFQVPRRPPLPKVADPAWSRNPIDAFVGAAHEKVGLRPRPPAAKETLLRRVFLDLIGLPPTRDELRAFLVDDAPDAYEKVVDRLLSDPRHGERWARHWMDVWRYSDWYGRRAVPDVWNSAPQVFRWRDWIVRSLNADRGYDQMVQEMLAGDEIAPENPEARYATGYLARNWYALNPNQWMRDDVEHTGKAFLGLTLNCAHCHDHKYDPISQEEYFRFRAFFEPIGLRQDRVAGEPDPGPFQKYDYAVLRKVVRIGSVCVFDENPGAKTLMYSGGDERSLMPGRPPVAPGAPAFLGGDRLKIEPVSLPADVWYPGLRSFVQHEEIARCETALRAAEAEQTRLHATAPLSREIAEATLARARAELASVRARIAADTTRFGHAPGDANVLSQEASKAERTFTLRIAEERQLRARQAADAARTKGNAAVVKQAETALAAAGKVLEAARKNLASGGTSYTPFSPVYPKMSTGRRRALALWLTSRDNPLTARVAVNHLWGWYFQRPLVETVFDFGRNGKRPSHPELLDWLAVELMAAEHWNMRRLHRLIVTSNVYRLQAGAGSPDNPNLAIDPDNRLLWRFNARRMEAEVVRDAILRAAGELDSAMGGYPLDNIADAGSRRRSLYFSVYPEGGGHLGFLELFDAPDPCDCYRRSESIVPQQALALTNGPLLLDYSRLLARKLSAQVPAGIKENAERQTCFVRMAFEQVLTRSPAPQELSTCLEFLRRQEDVYRHGKAPSAKSPGATMALAAAPAQRARESLIRVLFNHDDFVTVR